MSTYKLLDPAIRKTIDAFPKFEFTTQVLPIIRRAESEALVLADALASGVAREEIEVPGLELGQPPVRCLKYIPVSTPGSGAAYLHIHGGGYLLGSPESTDQRNVFLANELGITIVSVDYRLAPEHPAPAGLDDCYAALAWLHDNADSLGIDTARIAIGGESAGADWRRHWRFTRATRATTPSASSYLHILCSMTALAILRPRQTRSPVSSCGPASTINLAGNATWGIHPHERPWCRRG